jgi:flagellar assembly protein FliH
MTSLSKVIKSNWTDETATNARVIGIKSIEKKQEIEIEIENEFQVDESRENALQKIEKAHNEALQIIDNARNEANLIQSNIESEKLLWVTEKEALQAEAYEEAYKKGLHSGLAQAKEDYQDKMNQVHEHIERAKQEFQNQIDQAQNVILDLGIKSAERILGKMIEEDPNTFLNIVKRGLKAARDYKEIQIHVSPDFFDFVDSQMDELNSIFPTDTKCYLYPNEDLGKSQCFIESNQGRIDISIDSQLKEIKEKLLEILEGDED